MYKDVSYLIIGFVLGVSLLLFLGLNNKCDCDREYNPFDLIPQPTDAWVGRFGDGEDSSIIYNIVKLNSDNRRAHRKIEERIKVLEEKAGL